MTVYDDNCVISNCSYCLSTNNNMIETTCMEQNTYDITIPSMTVIDRYYDANPILTTLCPYNYIMSIYECIYIMISKYSYIFWWSNKYHFTCIRLKIITHFCHFGIELLESFLTFTNNTSFLCTFHIVFFTLNRYY